MSDITVEIYCDGSEQRPHVVREIAAYDCDAHGKWWVGSRPDRGRQRARQAQKRTSAGKPPNLITNGLLDTQPLVCKLCGQRLPHWRDESVMAPILNDIVARHARLRVRLSDLPTATL
jgi:hypothetical protein